MKNKYVRILNQKLTQIFKSYVGQSVLDEILKTNDDFLQANYADVSVLIVDIVGFTKTVEALNLQKSAKLIKSILELLTKAVIATNGTLDKYNGDGLIAFWGAPLEDKNHAENCIFAAIKMFDFLDQFNKKYKKYGGKSKFDDGFCMNCVSSNCYCIYLKQD